MITQRELVEKYQVPEDVKDLFQEGSEARDSGEYGRALLMFLDILKDYPENPRILNAVARTYRWQRRFKQAEECFLQTIAIAPDYVFAYNNLSLMYCDMGEHEKAANYARRSIALLKSSAIPWNTLGIYYLDIGEVRRALEHFKASYGYNSEFNKAAYNIACCYSLLGEKEKALDYLAKGLDKLRRIELAENDPDFDNIRNLPEFKQILKDARAKVVDEG
ncbi:MAG: tetratricopeptide repeat protein [bacterium]|nr:tetratricopeptide repeat protein [bacterium]